MNSQNSFNVISTFSGCGGSSLGYKLAGFNIILAVEWNENAIKTYKKNFPDAQIYHGDINKLKVRKVKEIAGIKEKELDVLDGSPPCQGFSMAGKRVLKDNRNNLYQEYLRLLEGLKPKVFVMENVKGLITGKMKLVFTEILKEMKSIGYEVQAKLMNSKYYNVPQSRERVIFIGVRKDLNIKPSHPKPQNKPITVRQALKDVNNEKWELDWVNHIKNSSIYPRIKRMPQGGNYSDYNPTGSGFTLQRINYDKPCPTIMKTVCHSASSDGLIHPEKNRKLTISEIKKLHSFPDDFKFIGNFTDQWARIGNSVPPNMMKAISKNIKNNILNKLK